MEFREISHKNAHILINDKKFKKLYNEITSTLKSISDDDIKSKFKEYSLRVKSQKSLSKSINELIKERLELKGWNSESALFRQKPYSNKNQSRWRLDFAKDKISVEVGFNHGEAIAHNLIKPVLASQQNHVRKEVETEIGVIITATNELKKAGNFDSAVGSFEKYESYLLPYSNILSSPLLLIGLEAPKTFIIDKTTKKIKVI